MQRALERADQEISRLEQQLMQALQGGGPGRGQEAAGAGGAGKGRSGSLAALRERVRSISLSLAGPVEQQAAERLQVGRACCTPWT